MVQLKEKDVPYSSVHNSKKKKKKKNQLKNGEYNVIMLLLLSR